MPVVFKKIVKNVKKKGYCLEYVNNFFRNIFDKYKICWQFDPVQKFKHKFNFNKG